MRPTLNILSAPKTRPFPNHKNSVLAGAVPGKIKLKEFDRHLEILIVNSPFF
jgi:hypothetical protein